MEIKLRPKCLLLIGPTGSGKTPLGWAAEKAGIWDIPCLHFDFGSYLRRAAENPNPDIGFSQAESDTISRVVRTKELLQSEDFDIARKIFSGFLKENQKKMTYLILLNGLPRHIEQAENMDGLADIRGVIELICSPSIVYARIQGDAGGDRSGRLDDSWMDIQQKLIIYEKMTKPLVDHYRRRGKFYMNLNVTISMSPEQMLEHIEQKRDIGISCMG